jgi:predicted DNA-binding transcriptional regulator YafY
MSSCHRRYEAFRTTSVLNVTLGAGAAMPPLLLDDDEAVAVAVGLRTAACSPVTGIEETSVRALAKLENILPSRLRRRVSALADYTVPIPPDSPGRPDRADHARQRLP